MNDKVVKPVTIIKEEFTNELISTINKCPLPMFLIEYVLKDILNEVHINVTRQLQEDGKKYEQALEQQEDKDKKEE